MQRNTRCIVLAKGEVKQSLYILLSVDIVHDILQRRIEVYTIIIMMIHHIIYVLYIMYKVLFGKNIR